MRSRPPRALLAVPLATFAILAPLACSPGGADDASGLDRPPSRLVKPDPVTVRAVVDTSMAATEFIDARRGGQVATMDAERGLMYTLTIPPNALLASERITMSPIRTMEGLPLSGGLTGAVQLEPHGLQLAAPATLRITTFDAATGMMGTPPGSHVGFGAEGDGREFRLGVASESDSGIVIHLSHFSIGGGAQGTAGDIAAQAARAPSSPSAQYEQRVAAAIELASAHAGVDGSPTSDGAAAALHEELVGLYRGAYHEVVRPALVAGRASDDALATAAATFLGWMRNFLLVGIPDEEFAKEAAEGQKLLEAAMVAAYERAVDRCRKGIDLGALSTMLMLERSAQLLGHAPGRLFPDLQEQIDACTAVDVAFESRIDFYWADGVTNARDVVRASIPLEFDLATGAFTGRGPLEYVSASGVTDGRLGGGAGALFGGCLWRVIGPAKPGEFEVLGLFLARRPKTVPRAALGDSISLLIDPGTPQKRSRTEGCKQSVLQAGKLTGTVTESDGWRPSWEDQHRAEQMEWGDSAARGRASGEKADSRPVWLMSQWEPGSGAVLARRTFATTLNNELARVVEHTTIELRRRVRR